MGALSAALCACSAPPMVPGPLTMAPSAPIPNIEHTPGSIFQTSTAANLFEDPSTYYVGDILKVEVSESLSGSAKANTGSSQDSSLNYKGPGATGQSTGIISGILDSNFAATSGNNFKGDGNTASSNNMTGTITVSVIQVYPNGNLGIAGEKSISTNGNVSTLRFSGIVRKRDIRPGNTVASANVADVRLEQLGNGVISDANSLNWLARKFRSILSF
jgi:flagellar L-ring protein precursor FlgH